ncbi:MAG: ribosome maturation factor RimP [Fervidobacterium sp.]|jgi:ribosome maturation factor RimP
MSLSQKEIIERVRALAGPIVSSMGLELFDVKYRTQGGKWVLTIVIDKHDDYVSTRDCELVSYEIEKVLDSHDLIPGRYFLEVSSPGLDRPLKKLEDFKRFIGKLAKVKTKRTYKGYIKAVNMEKEEIVLTVDNEDIVIKYDEIKSANLEIEV